MNKKPVSYLQYDSRWGQTRYPTRTGSIGISGGGCGPTSCAMLISTLLGREVLPTETMEWACAKGWVWNGYGVVTGDYFPAQFAKYGLKCERLTYWTKASIEADIRAGYYFIAGMGPGLWTSRGHFVVLWDIDSKMRINDPASTANDRTNGDPTLFWGQVKTMYRVDARSYNHPMKEDNLDMTKKEFLESLTGDEVAALVGKLSDDQLNTVYQRLVNHKSKAKPSDWAKISCEKAIKSGLFYDGDRDGLLDAPQAPLTREQFAAVLDRKGILDIPGANITEEG